MKHPQEFDAATPAIMEPPALFYAQPDPQRSSILKMFLVPVGWRTTAVAIVSMLLFFWASRMPLADFLFGFAAALLWIAVVLSWLPRFLVQVIFALFQIEFPSRKTVRGWIVPPLILLVTFIALRMDLPLKATIAINRPAMDRFAQQMMAPGAIAPSEARVGMFTAVRITRFPGGVRFLCTGSGFFRAAGGFAYSPNGPPPQEDPSDDYTPIGDGWYIRKWIRD